MKYISYDERCIEFPSGFCFIWLYSNKERQHSCLELLLDNNALVGANRWLEDLAQNYQKIQINKSDRVGFCPSLYLALTEQYLSNDEYRNNIITRTDSLIKPFTDLKIPFDNNFSKNIQELLLNNEKQNKTDWMTSYLYVILLYRITFAKKNDNKPFEILRELKNKNVPCFTSLIMLCCLAEFLNKNKNIKMISDNKAAYSYLSSFIDKHGSKKGEDGLVEKYFCNRAGDLTFWLAIPKLIQNGYEPQGELMVVTDDKALKKFIFRCFPFVWDNNKTMCVSFDEKAFEKHHANEIRNLIEETVWTFSIPTTDKEKFTRLENLKKHVTDGLDENIINVVENIWNEWILEGWGKPFQIK